MSINKVFISGNLTRDAEVKRTASGMSIVSFSVAVNERRKNNQTGEYDNYANFIDCTWFGTYAEKCAGALTKGAKVTIEGRLRWSQWEREGQKRSKLEVIAEEVELPPRQQGQFNPPQAESVYDASIPF